MRDDSDVNTMEINAGASLLLWDIEYSMPLEDFVADFDYSCPEWNLLAQT